MKSESSRFHFCLLVLCASLLISSSNQNHSHNHVALFIFGDSLFDSGNNNYLKNAIGRANFWPFGETFFKQPAGRFSDGRLISDFIAEYLKLPLIPPYLQPGIHQFTDGVNFASGGASALVETSQGNEGRDIYKIGGRKFAFVGMGAFDCAPKMRALKQHRGHRDKEATSLENYTIKYFLKYSKS